MPERGPPTAPILMRSIGIKDEPAALHLGVAQGGAAPAGHLVRRNRQVHVLGRIAVQIENVQWTVAGRKASARVRVTAALSPTAAVAVRILEATGTTGMQLIGRAIAPALVGRMRSVVGLAHAVYPDLGWHALRQ